MEDKRRCQVAGAGISAENCRSREEYNGGGTQILGVVEGREETTFPQTVEPSRLMEKKGITHTRRGVSAKRARRRMTIEKMTHMWWHRSDERFARVYPGTRMLSKVAGTEKKGERTNENRGNG